MPKIMWFECSSGTFRKYEQTLLVWRKPAHYPSTKIHKLDDNPGRYAQVALEHGQVRIGSYLPIST